MKKTNRLEQNKKKKEMNHLILAISLACVSDEIVECDQIADGIT